MILALEVEFLTGRCVTTDRENRSRPEWPPHPDRLFAALAAAYFERKADPEAETPEEQAEREALEWLSAQRNLSLHLPNYCGQRTAVTTYVPVNDSEQLKKKGEPHSRIGEGWEFRRNRQERGFPTVLPDPPTLVYRWEVRDEAAIERHRPALARLAANVSYLGHSSSLVRVGVHPNPPAATLRPAKYEEPAECLLRVPHLGRLQQLSQAYQLSRRFNRRIEPQKALELGFVSVNKAKDFRAQTHFDDDLIVFRKTDGPYLPLHAVLQLTSTVRRALISLADPVPAVLSGHEPDGKTLSAVHLAIVPLANVDHRHADGDIKGFALVLPRSLRQGEQRSERRAVLKAIGRLQELTLGRSGVWRVEQVLPGSSQLKALTATVWTKPSRNWASVTPLIFGRFPKRRGTSKRDWMSSPDVIKMIQEQIQMVGLQDEHGEPLVPKGISVVPASPVLGVPPSSQFPSLSTAGKPLPPRARGRLRAHVTLEFDREVQGPLILGAGRYLGMGFFRPVQVHKKSEQQHEPDTK